MVIKGLNPPAGSTVTEFEGMLATERVDLFTGPFAWPVMTLDDAALAHNLATMAQYAARNGFELAPHIKTHMSARLWQRQQQAGAWGATVATGDQLRTARSWGTRRILLANQLADPRELSWLAQQASQAEEGFEVWLYADSHTGVELLAPHLAIPGVRERVGVLIERGHPGGRTGVRTLTEAVELARAADAAGLRVIGVSGYEGSVAKGTDPESLAAVAHFCNDLLVTSRAVAPLVTGGRPVLSLGGSAYLDVVQQVLAGADDVRVVVRAGSYLTHDHGTYTRSNPWARMPRETAPRDTGSDAGNDTSSDAGNDTGSELQPALRLWAQVLSTPEAGLVLCGAGRRDAPFDADLPIPLRVHDTSGAGPGRAISGATTRLNDQHLFLHTDDAVAVGEVIEFGISHPCTSFDKWRTLPLLQDQRVVGLVHTEF